MRVLGVVSWAANLGVSWWNEIVSAPMAEVIPHPTYAAKSPQEKIMWLLRQEYPAGMTLSQMERKAGMASKQINEVLNDLIADCKVKMSADHGSTYLAMPPERSNAR